MMSGVPLETCWAFKKLWNNKFYYKAASCWYFYRVIYDARIHEYQILCCTSCILWFLNAWNENDARLASFAILHVCPGFYFHRLLCCGYSLLHDRVTSVSTVRFTPNISDSSRTPWDLSTEFIDQDRLLHATPSLTIHNSHPRVQSSP